MNKMLTIEVETLFGCKPSCPYFNPVVNSVLYGDGKIVEKTYKCENLEMCKVIDRRFRR